MARHRFGAAILRKQCVHRLERCMIAPQRNGNTGTALGSGVNLHGTHGRMSCGTNGCGKRRTPVGRHHGRSNTKSDRRRPWTNLGGAPSGQTGQQSQGEWGRSNANSEVCRTQAPLRLEHRAKVASTQNGCNSNNTKLVGTHRSRTPHAHRIRTA